MTTSTPVAAGMHRGPSRSSFPVLALVVIAVNLPQSVMVPVLPHVRESFGTDQVTASWLITGFLLSSGIATPLLGRLGDRYGARRVMLFALGTLVIGSIGTVLAPTIGWAIATRFLQGVSGGAVPVAFSALRGALPPEQLRYGVAVLATVGSIAFSAGIVAAGPMLNAWGLTSLFALTSVVAVLAAIGVFVVVPAEHAAEPPGRLERISPVPVILFSAGLVAILIAISQGNSRGWTSPTVLGLLGAALLLGAGWARAERRTALPFIDLDMMRLRGMWTANLVALLAGIGLFGCAAGLPPLLQSPTSAGFGVGASLDAVGLLMMPIALSAFLTSLCTGALFRVVPARLILVSGGALSAASYVAIALWHDSAWQFVAWCALQGIGNGLILSTVASVVMASVPARQTGVANGMNTNIRTIGGSLGTAVTAAILAAHTGVSSSGTRLISERGFEIAFGVMAVAMAVASLAALLVPRDPADSALRVARADRVELADLAP